MADESRDETGASADVIPFRRAPEPKSTAQGTPEIDPSVQRVLDEIQAAVGTSEWVRTARDDRRAIEEERWFRRRFGFVVHPEWRKKVIAYKHAKGLTDGEIRLLWWTSNLDLEPEEPQITTSTIVATWGYIQLAALALLMLTALLAALRAPATWGNLGACAAIQAVLVLLIEAIRQFYVRPNQIRRRVLGRSIRHSRQASQAPSS